MSACKHIGRPATAANDAVWLVPTVTILSLSLFRVRQSWQLEEPVASERALALPVASAFLFKLHLHALILQLELEHVAA